MDMRRNRNIFNIIVVAVLLAVTNISTYNLATSDIGIASDDKIVKIKALENYVRDNYLYNITDEEFEIGELKGVVSALDDPYSEYLTKEDYKKLTDNLTGKFCGIGVFISGQESKYIQVVSPIKGSPAEKAGIKSGDEIVKIDGKEYSAAQISEATDIMRGEKGTGVKITVIRPSENNAIYDFNIIRDEVKAETVICQNLKGIGYIGITQFGEQTADDFKKALKTLEKSNVKGLIIDLRGNPGGIVESASEIADTLLPEGMIVYAKDREHKIVFEEKSGPRHSELPLVVLINSGSASASEILAGAIRDYNRGVIIGERSFGKGIVQSVVRFPGGDGIKLTTSEYFSPKGINIHKKGIKPDISVILPPEVTGIGVEHQEEDRQLQKAIEVLREQINR